MIDALVIGASGGIGAAVADAMEARGGKVTRVSRAADGLDVTDPASVARAMGALEGPFQTVFVAVGVLAPPDLAPEKQLGDLDPDVMAQVFAVNTIGVAQVLTHLPRLLPRKGRSVTGVLTARVGSIGDNRMGGWHSYRASKAALNQVVRGVAVELGRSHREAVVAALHPGTVATPFTEKYLGRHPAVSADVAATNLQAVIAGLTSADTGKFFDWSGKEVPW